MFENKHQIVVQTYISINIHKHQKIILAITITINTADTTTTNPFASANPIPFESASNPSTSSLSTWSPAKQILLDKQTREREPRKHKIIFVARDARIMKYG